MELDKVKPAWNAQQIQEAEIGEIVSRMTRSAKRRRILLALCLFNVAVTSVVIAFVFVTKAEVGWRGAWPGLLAQAIAACYLIDRLIRSFRPKPATALRQTVSATLQDIRAQLRNMKFFAATLVVIVVLVLIMLPGLHQSGKMNQQALLSFGFLCVAILTGNAVAIYFRCRKLIPQRDRLVAIEADLRD